MTNLDIPKVKQIFSALNNERRIKIVELCSKREYTITQLSRELKLNYSVTVEYISMLEKIKLVEKRRNENKTVSVKSLIVLHDNGEIRRV